MKYFFAGIKGSGMASLASMLHDWGNEVIGCDDATYYTFTDDELQKRGIKVYKDTEKLTKDMILYIQQQFMKITQQSKGQKS